jgi:hypothetical protein
MSIKRPLRQLRSKLPINDAVALEKLKQALTDGGANKFSKNLCTSPFNEGQSNYIIFSQIYLA